MLPPSQCPLKVAKTLTSDPAYFEKAEHLHLVIFWGVGVDCQVALGKPGGPSQEFSNHEACGAKA